jgi:tRNA nucleotidyltransferase (CCA-adding enzyme)
VDRTIEDFVRSLGLDAYLVGGAVRDELAGLDSKDADFLVPGVGHDALRDALASHGKVDDFEVAGRRVGVRLYPRDPELRRLAPAGIEFAPPRVERSTGPGRHDFEIVADPSISVEDDMRRRDFTVNAIARRLETGQLVDPFGGADDLQLRLLRTVTTRSFLEDPLRVVRGLRLVSQLGLEPDAQTVEQMRRGAESVRLVSVERIGGGLKGNGLGELSKLLLGHEPAHALRLARDTGVLLVLLPEFAAAVGYDQESELQHLPLDEHVFAVVQAAADASTPLAVRLAALFHDLGKPAADRGEGRHAELGAQLAGVALARLRYPTSTQDRVVRIVREHAFPLDEVDDLRARRFLRRHGDELSFDLVAHKEADLRGKQVPTAELEAAARLRELLSEQIDQPHRLADLAVDGADLIAVGFSEGPELGRALDTLLDEVVEEPERNTHEMLLERARALVP